VDRGREIKTSTRGVGRSLDMDAIELKTMKTAQAQKTSEKTALTSAQAPQSHL